MNKILTLAMVCLLVLSTPQIPDLALWPRAIAALLIWPHIVVQP